MYVANCSLKYNPEDFTVVNKVLTLAGNTQLVGDAFVAHHCGGLLLDGGVFAEKKVDSKYVVCLVDETPTSYIKAKCSLLVDGDAFEIVDGALSLKAVEPSGFDITWDGNTEGLEDVEEQYYKVSNSVENIKDSANLIGATITTILDNTPTDIILSAENIATEDNKVFVLIDNEMAVAMVAFEDGEYAEMLFSKGVWFIGGSELYTSHLYKE